MDKVRVRPLRPHEQKKLRRLKRQKSNGVNSRHARVILLSRGGLRNRDIAALVDCSPSGSAASSTASTRRASSASSGSPGCTPPAGRAASKRTFASRSPRWPFPAPRPSSA